MSLGLSSGFLAAVHLVSPCEKPQTHSSGYLSASLGVRLQLYRKVSLFVQLQVLKVVCGTLSQFYFSCL